MSHIALWKGGRETAKFHLLPDGMGDLDGAGVFIHETVGAHGKERAVAAAESFSRDWAERLGLDRLSVGGFPIPSLVYLQFRFRMTFLFLLMEFARHAVFRERPERAVLSGVFPDEGRALRVAFESLGVSVKDRGTVGGGGIGGAAFRLGARARRVAEVTIPRYGTYLRRIVRADRTAQPREDPRILVADTFCITPEAARYLRERGTLLHVLDNDKGMKKNLLKAGLPFRSVPLNGRVPGDWPTPGAIRFPGEGISGFAYQGIPFFPLIEEDIRRAVGETARRLFTYLSLSGEGFRKIVLREQNGPEGKILVWLARQAGIPTVMMQHGLMGGDYGYLPMDADIFIAWGEDGRRWLASKGVPPEKLKVIGCPRFDVYGTKGDLAEGDKFRKRLLVLFESTEYAGEDSPLDNYRLLQLVLNALAPLPGWSVSVRFHPAQTAGERERCRRLLQPYGTLVRIARETVLKTCLEKADVVVTESSTAGIEALLNGNILLVVRRRDIAGNPYAWTDALPQADTPEEIRTFLNAWECSREARTEAWDRGKRFLAGYLRREEEPASVRFWKYCLS